MASRKKIRIAISLFLGSILITVFSVVRYLQSEKFAFFIKDLISERAPTDLGITGDFQNVKLHFFPPGIGVSQPKVKVSKQNIANLPIEAEINATEVWVSFAPVQMLSGRIRVDRVVISEGVVDVEVTKEALRPQKKKSAVTFRFDDLLNVELGSIQLQNTLLQIHSKELNFEGSGVVQDLQIEKVDAAVPEFRSVARIQGLNLPLQNFLGPKVDFPIYKLEWDLSLSQEGLRVQKLDLQGPGTLVDGGFEIRGDLFDQNSDPEIVSKIKLQTQLDYSAPAFNLNFLEGNLALQLEGQGKLKNLDRTFKGPVQIVGKQIQIGRTPIQDLAMNANANLGSRSIEKFDLKATGKKVLKNLGSVHLQADRIPIEMNSEIPFTLNLDQAELRWLVAEIEESIDILLGEYTGTIQGKFNPVSLAKGKFEIKANAKIAAEHFQLLNVLEPKKTVYVEGPVRVSDSGVEFKDVKVSTGDTRLLANGGVNGDGYDIQGQGNISLNDLKTVAGNRIAGNGEVKVRVHGPSSRVLIDIDADLNEAEYLEIKFGKVKGRITYDDGISELRFSNVKAAFGKTFYSLPEGMIDVSGGDDIHLPITIHDGRMEDLAVILGNLLKNIHWYPQDLVGQLSGSVNISGKLDLDRLKILAIVDGRDFETHGEKFRSIRARVGFDSGVYFADPITATKTVGDIAGRIRFHANKNELNWNLESRDLSTKDLDFLERLNIPARARIQIRSEGSGKMNDLVSKSSARFYDAILKGERLQESRMLLESADQILKGELNIFGSQLLSNFRYAMTLGQPSQVNLDFNRFDFSPILLILNPRHIDDPLLSGQLNGKMILDFQSGKSEFARGQVVIDRYLLQKTGLSVSLGKTLSFPVQYGFFKIDPTPIKFNDQQLVLSGEGNRGNLDVSLIGKLNLKAAEFFTSAIVNSKGLGDLDLRLVGPFKEPIATGTLDFRDAQILFSFVQTPIENLSGTVRIRGGILTADRAVGYIGESPIRLSGKVQTFTDRFPAIDLKVLLNDNRVRLDPLDYAQGRGTISIEGEKPPYVIGGNLDVTQALWTKSFSKSSGTVREGDRFAPEATGAAKKSSLFVMDLPVSCSKGFLVRNEIMDAEFKGKVRVIGEPNNPHLLGQAELVQGKILFRDRPFQIEDVKVDFDTPYQLDPKFSASAVTEINSYKVRVLAQGRASKFKAELSSAPFLTESEIYQLLTSGFTSKDLGRFRTSDRTYVNQGEAASLLLHSLEFSKGVEQQTGFQLEIGESVDINQATSAFRPQSMSDNVAAPKVVVRRKLGQKFDLSVGSTVGVGTQNSREVSARYQVRPGVSLLGVWNNIEGVNTRDTRSSYGIDLRLDKNFK